MMASANPGWDRETSLVARIAACISVAAFLYCLRHDQILLYGDAVAHMNIARRVIDSRTPGLLQLGTVWLPLPHLLMIPFLFSHWFWQTGIGGSIPSLVSFVAGATGIFRLVRGQDHSPAKRIAAWAAAVIFVANPNLIYLQTTALTEPLYLALFIWTLVYFREFLRDHHDRLLLKSAACAAAASLTRYDGWFLVGALGIAVTLSAIRKRSIATQTQFKFFLIVAAGPLLWLTYNAAVYKNPLEFANGPYSAKAIEERTSTPGSPPHPGAGDLPMAGSFFLKAAELNLAESNWHRLWLVAALGGSFLLLVVARAEWPLLLLWLPLGVYSFSVGYSGVPIFLPPWWPHSYYNVRYGIEFLPAAAVLATSPISFLWRKLPHPRSRMSVVVAAIALVAASYVSVWRAQPISFREGWFNSRTRIALETELAKHLQKLPQNATFLAYLGDHAGAWQRAGIPLRHIIHEGNHRTWKQPTDPEGEWERALQDPARYADFVVISEGDAVFTEANKNNLVSILVVHVTGQPQTTIYRTVKDTSHGM
jgi:hypothetical protein